MATPKKKPVKKRSDEGRNESKRGKVAGKGFVVAKTTKNERKAQGKALGKMAAIAAPGGAAVKGALAVKKAVAVKKATKAKSVAAEKSAQAKKDYYNKSSIERSKTNSGMVRKNVFEGPSEVFVKTPATLKRKPNLPKKSK
jgi:hypothetical protein